MEMDYTMPLTVLTPTYNRADCLLRLFNSLVSQTVQDFQWLIIDDGSTDNTAEVVEKFRGNKFRLDYKKKVNGGKHTAINFSCDYIKGKNVCIVDSDDWLLPEAVETIIKMSRKYRSYKNVKGLTFLRGRNKEDAICTTFPQKPTISNHIDFRINAHRVGDCFEILATDVLKQCPFPEQPGERFLGEGYLWNNMGFRYDTVYIPEIIYICDYLDGGLTKSGRKLRIACPLGGMDNSNSFFARENGRRVNEKTLCKESMLFVCYGKFAGLRYREIIEKAKDKDHIKHFYLLGCVLFLYWKFKYVR